LEDIRKNQSERIATLRAEIKAVNTRYHDLLEENSGLRAEIQQLTEERNAAENMLDFERNKYELQLKTRSSGLAKQLTYEIGLELETLRDLVEGLDSNNQRRFGRRLNSIEQYLREFGGEE
jgi:regulator of replication initiation timing